MKGILGINSMKLNDVIDIDGKLYHVIYVGSNGSFEAEPIGEVVVKGFVREQNLSRTDKMDILKEYCDNRADCHKWDRGIEIPCPLYDICKNSYFYELTDIELDEAYNIVKEKSND